MKRKAYAKINLTLDVVGKRNDGYHDLAMVMLPLELHDLLAMEISDSYQFTSNVPYLDSPEKNSIYQTIEEMRQRYGFKEQFYVNLKKYIPTQAGLGGGSSDAASTIHLVNELLQLKLDKREMERVALAIGCDVPFCLYSYPALAEGKGERLMFFRNNCDFFVLLVKPESGVLTTAAYALLQDQTIEHFPAQMMITALTQNDYPAVVSNLGNSFEEVTGELIPLTKQIKKELLEFGFDGALLCGSGSCVFAISQDEGLLDRAVEHFRGRYPYVWKTRVKR